MGEKVSKVIIKRTGEARQEFVKLIRKLAARHTVWSVFEDFLRVASISVANSSDPYHSLNGERIWQEREARYVQIMKSYSLEERQLFPPMLGYLTQELESQVAEGHLRDVLGEVFHELELHNKWKGQFFTPQIVSDVMGMISMNRDTAEKAIKTYGFVSVNEPCCGSGAMLYGLANAFRKFGYNYCTQMLISAQDLDERCVMMTYLQCALYGLPAIVVQMNTLSLERYDAPWFTPVYIIDLWQYKERKAVKIKLANEELTAALDT